MIYLTPQGTFERLPEEPSWIDTFAQQMAQNRQLGIQEKQADTAAMSSMVQGLGTLSALESTRNTMEYWQLDKQGYFDVKDDEKESIINRLNNPDVLAQLDIAIKNNNRNFLDAFKDKLRSITDVDPYSLIPKGDKRTLERIAQYGFTKDDLKPVWEKKRKEKELVWWKNKEIDYSADKYDFTGLTEQVINSLKRFGGIYGNN